MISSTRDLKPRRLGDYEMNLALSAMNWIADAPLHYKDVQGRPDESEWFEAIDKEIQSLNENQTWEIVKSPSDAKFIGSRWIFKKKEEVGEKFTYKARLVARGFQQREGIDYGETYAPVARLPTIRLILALTMNFKLFSRHLDVTTAFLYGKLEEDVYLKTPEGVSCPEGKSLKLKRSLYGLKQSPKCWNTRFHEFIVTLGFHRSRSDYCLYIWSKKNSIVYLVLYVDDMLIAGNDEHKINSIVDDLKFEFKMKDLGQVRRFMGLNVTFDKESNLLVVDQNHYIQKIIDQFEMSDCNPCLTPIDANLKIKKENNGPTTKPFRELVGSLMFLALGSRPDISFVVTHSAAYKSGQQIHTGVISSELSVISKGQWM